MNIAVRSQFRVCEANDPAARDEVFRFRYRVYVEVMNRRQKYADHIRRIIAEPLDDTATIYAAYLGDRIIGTIRGNRFSDPATEYYRKIYRIDDRFDYRPEDMTLTTKLMVEPALQRTTYPIKLILHYADNFHFGNGCRIDFLDCNAHLIKFFEKFGYVDYHGWVVHSEYGTVRPMCVPTDQLARFAAIGSPLGPIARRYYADNEFGGADLAERLSRARAAA
jgi:hypothetical protein